jgi:hypothetical protein
MTRLIQLPLTQLAAERIERDGSAPSLSLDRTSRKFYRARTKYEMPLEQPRMSKTDT